MWTSGFGQFVVSWHLETGCVGVPTAAVCFGYFRNIEPIFDRTK